jgi:hypothetical protein
LNDFPTRRQLREAERTGQVTTLPEPVVIETEIVATAPIEAPAIHALPQAEVFISRKERREAEKRGEVPASITKTVEATSEASKASSQEIQGAFDHEVQTPSSSEMEPIEVVHQELSLELSDVQVPEVEIPSVDFNGTNLFAEPSTQSIVLDIAPEAISLPIETGEITITGSITVLSDTSSNVITDSLDGMALDNADRQDAVTGIISIVEPVSALDLIGSRVSVGVVPQAVLRKGWWRKWALGVIALGMVIAAIIATITITNIV